MKLLRTISKLKLAGLIAIALILTSSTVAAYNIFTPPETTTESTQIEQVAPPIEITEQAPSVEQPVETSEDQTDNDPAVSTSAQATTQIPETNTVLPTQTATSPAPVTPTCNESMKSSYASLYDAQVVSENASWNNQISAWQSDAQRRGMAFSGFVQGQIDANKPAHDARLAQLLAQYQLNVMSINCNP